MQVEQLLGRSLADLDVAVLMIDGGRVFADHCCVVALAITADGTKVPVGLWLGDTGSTTVVRTTALLADLVVRGLDHTPADCWWSSMVPRHWQPGCARCSAQFGPGAALHPAQASKRR